MKRILIIVAAVTLAASLVAAQPVQQPAQQQAQPSQAQPAQAPPAPGGKKQPQAKTKDEYEAIQKLQDQSVPPDQKIVLAEEFLVKYPNSELKSFVYRTEMTAYQQKNDFTNMLETGEKVLEMEPEDVVTLIALAGAIPERVRENDLDKDQKLKKAEDFANRGLAAVDKLTKPNPQIPDEQWNAMKQDAKGQIYAALGMVALNRKQYSAAEENLKKAGTMEQQKDPIVYWRLGLVLQNEKKYEEARDALKQSVALGGVKAGGRDYAAESLKTIEDFLAKRQSGGTPPQQPQAPPKQP